MVYKEEDIRGIVEALTSLGHELASLRNKRILKGPKAYTLNSVNLLINFLKRKKELTYKDFEEFQPSMEEFSFKKTKNPDAYYAATLAVYWAFDDIMFGIKTNELPLHVHEENELRRQLVFYRLEHGH